MADAYDRKKEVKEFDESRIGVKGLSDSGIKTIPQMFIQPPEKISGVASSADCVGIPVIDLSDVHLLEKRAAIVEKIRDAAGNWGFFQVVKHSVPLSVLDEIIGAIKAFHEQPQAAKAEYYARDEHGGVTFSSNHDLFRSGSGRTPRRPRGTITSPCGCHPRLWRLRQIGFQPCTVGSWRRGTNTRREAGTWWRGFCRRDWDWIEEDKRIVFVGDPDFWRDVLPVLPATRLDSGAFGSYRPGVLTILLPNQVWGLQVLHGGKWVDVKPLPGALIFNIGDFLQIVSNGEYKSVQHRVLANSHKEPRISIVHWFDVGNWSDSDEYGPLSELISPEKPAQYRRFTKQEYVENFYSKGLDSKSLVEKLKL
ncbi:hypothetical protein DH2020_039813 [Rehmannia glutinosa]|uniref:Fe2OG dioxygenase domain-containing protein n=1 Tax=Rehmannia glutinosa TaxID=99300 RepID=A0ABR0UUQ5_REHGL